MYFKRTQSHSALEKTPRRFHDHKNN